MSNRAFPIVGEGAQTASCLIQFRAGYFATPLVVHDLLRCFAFDATILLFEYFNLLDKTDYYSLIIEKKTERK